MVGIRKPHVELLGIYMHINYWDSSVNQQVGNGGLTSVKSIEKQTQEDANNLTNNQSQKEKK